jgi:uncharacterized membrane protein
MGGSGHGTLVRRIVFLAKMNESCFFREIIVEILIGLGVYHSEILRRSELISVWL